MTRLFSKAQIARITCIWILAVAAAGLLMGVTGGIHLPWNLGILAASLWLASKAFGFLMGEKKTAYFPAFMRINVYALSLMILLIGSSLL